MGSFLTRPAANKQNHVDSTREATCTNPSIGGPVPLVMTDEEAAACSKDVIDAVNQETSQNHSVGILRKPSDRKKYDDSGPRAHFDEENIRETYHPDGKEYGHIKVDEPPTPYIQKGQEFSPDELAAMLNFTIQGKSQAPPSSDYLPKNKSDDDVNENDYIQKRAEEKFAAKRAGHYANEFQAMQKAKELIKQDEVLFEKDTDVNSNTEFNKKV